MTNTPRLSSHRRYGVRQETSVLLPGGEEQPLCEYGERFKLFTDALVKECESATHSVHVHRAKLLLTDHYFRLRRVVPVNHQDTKSYDGHRCIYAVFVAAYDALEQIALRVVPPAFEIPPRPPARKRAKPTENAPDGITNDMIHQMIFQDGTT